MKLTKNGKYVPEIGNGLLIYTGNWAESRPYGEGLIEFPNGDIYQGEIEQEMHGKGTLYRKVERKLYIGTFDYGLKTEEFYVRHNVTPYLKN